MPDAPTLRRFYADLEHVFALTPPLIAELERITGSGIGGLCRRIFAGDFKHAEIVAVIRLALIGGGLDPETAAALVTTYTAVRPLVEAHELAVAILETVFFGAPQDVGDVLAAEDAELTAYLHGDPA
ncbi:gene transfer agent family protein [Propylenella binzhouense]|uniref:Gene transfer agent family protein n=1 Tax=Propylenella binzhouense TaxID=2555902 RepID=A0A964T1Y8_9HYPH|nr:gene transfer agent family protein [Propylenella binzhouense]MYZ46469.1 gene transfer agent family protein [Propylenella binzhouense]